MAQRLVRNSTGSAKASDRLESVLKLIQTLTSVTVAGLAIYGFFFTKIPDAILRDLHADSAEAKEEALELRRERRGLLDDLKSLQDGKKDLDAKIAQRNADLAALAAAVAEKTDELAKTQGDLDSTRQEIKLLSADIDRLKIARSTYVGSAEGLMGYASNLLQSVRIAELKNHLRSAMDLLMLPRWAAEADVYWEKLKRASSSAERDQLAREYRKGDERKLMAELGNGTFGESPGNFDRYRNAVRDHIAKDREIRETGHKLLADYVDGLDPKGLLPEDFRNYKAALQRFIADHHAALDEPLAVILDDTVGQAALAAEIRRAEDAQQNFARLRVEFFAVRTH